MNRFNLIKLNNINVRFFLILFLSIQLGIWGCVGLNFLGFKIPVIREFLSFIYIFILPGMIILKILKIYNISNISNLIYSLGLSISSVYFVGFTLNYIGSILYIQSPLSLIPLLITFTILNSCLFILCFFRDSEPIYSKFLDLSYSQIKGFILLCLIPFSFIIQSFFSINFFSNFMQMGLIIFFASFVIIISFYHKFFKPYYPLIIGFIAISLLYHYTLISNYIWGWDIQLEYFIANGILNQAYWDPAIFSNTNSMLSVTILLPFFSIISDMDMIWILKIVYPIIISFIPIALYEIFRLQTNSRIAFFSCFFFISFFGFYAELTFLIKQGISEIFLVLILMVIISNKLNTFNKSILLIIFGFSLILSHYGVSYIFIFSLFFVMICSFFYGKKGYKKNFQHLRRIILKTETSTENSGFPKNCNINNITGYYALVCFIFLILWYLNTSKLVLIRSPVLILHTIFDNLSELLNPTSVQGMNLILTTTISPLHNISKFIHLGTQILIILGFLFTFVNKRNSKFKLEYLFFSLSVLMLLILGISLPFFASSYNTSRIFHISLVLLSPFYIIGALICLKVIFSYIITNNKIKIVKYSYFFISTLLALYLLFNSGLLYELFNDDPTSPTLNRTLDAPFFNDQEVVGSIWLFSNKNSNIIYADEIRTLILISFEGKKQKLIINNMSQIKDCYIFTGTYNNVLEKFRLLNNHYINSKRIIYPYNKIYTNKRVQIYS